ncbi:hypothetical protein ORV05_02545 [Amycolatopsis cynarae]|uniref:Enoyl-CoA hydratase n=1 Tax=Amycolatopsis cynarae TaxID=2995223 RepID=A0ABY7B7I7_9PSEU|nr:hypothetical protein [Amycolatopsis sp. HUAS 11-8]WAL66713.1 hypothetical protein ORV05_02545 [Amycolatopsis sp. HUAS 11-8]
MFTSAVENADTAARPAEGDCGKPIVSAIKGEAMGSGLATGLLASAATPAFEASSVFEAMSFFGTDLAEALTAQVENRPPNFAEPLPW